MSENIIARFFYTICYDGTIDDRKFWKPWRTSVFVGCPGIRQFTLHLNRIETGAKGRAKIRSPKWDIDCDRSANRFALCDGDAY